MTSSSTLPLAGIRVLDLSTLLPGPMATLVLSDAGADVVKIERPGAGDEMRSYQPQIGDTSANYAILNRGKRVFAADLKDPADRDRVLTLAAQADVVLEQFRPGVADRLGFGYDDITAINPAVVYCSISGYGQDSPFAALAGHDLNYLAQAGLLGVVTGIDGRPSLPLSVIADLAGGTYPALVNILLALRSRDLTGRGCRLDISMTHNLQVLAYGYIATHQGGGGWPTPSAELLTGGSPRYQIYETSDGRHLAVAALEQKFWTRFVELMGLPDCLDDAGREREIITVVADRVRGREAIHWERLFAGEDVCVSVVATFAEAVDAGLVTTDGPRLITTPGGDVSTLHSPVVDTLRETAGAHPTPALSPLPDDPTTAWATAPHEETA